MKLQNFKNLSDFQLDPHRDLIINSYLDALGTKNISKLDETIIRVIHAS